MLKDTAAVMVTGGSGFIGSNFVNHILATTDANIVNIDKLTYAGNSNNLASLSKNPRYAFIHGDICDGDLVSLALAGNRPKAIVHFAAESHVDRSIAGPREFLRTNIEGTFTLLEAAREYCHVLPKQERAEFRFIHVSTDEVYGTLAPENLAFCESTPFAPNSPYAASKASSDHLVRAWFHTYGLPTIITNCSNNYGRFQFPEKLIPLMILNALKGKPLPIYGDGQQIRDWLYVEDHCKAITLALAKGRLGETYNVGGGNERSNLEVVNSICALLDEMRPRSNSRPHSELITNVKDRPGHDRRYAINATKIETELGWRAEESFETGLRKTVEWYLNNPDWIANVTSGAYLNWIDRNYSSRELTSEGEGAL